MVHRTGRALNPMRRTLFITQQSLLPDVDAIVVVNVIP